MRKKKSLPFIMLTQIMTSLFCAIVVLGASLPSYAQVIDFRITPSENASERHNELFDVSAVTAQDAWAVGHFNPAGAFPYVRQPLITHWDGSQWSVVPSPFVAANRRGTLRSVDAISSNNVWAVGTADNPSWLEAESLIEHWDGTSWSVIQSPNPGLSNRLNGISAVNENDIWAVGEVGIIDPVTQAFKVGPLTMHWDGNSWEVVPTPVENRRLNAVVAIASDDVWAVGNNVTLHWNGVQWEEVPLPDGGGARLLGVTAVSRDEVWAVGYGVTPVGDGGGIGFAIAIRWNGTQWEWRGPGIFGPPLNDVTAVPGTGVLYAVGGFTTARTRVVRWDGTIWRELTSEDILPWHSLVNTGNQLFGVDAVSPTDVLAVGNYSYFDYRTNGPRFYFTLTERLAAVPTPTPTPTPSPTPSPTPTSTYGLNGTPVVEVGGALTVNWTAPAGHSDTDWLGLFRVGAPNEAASLLWAEYMGSATSGSRTLPAPEESGEYEIRLFANDTYTLLATSNTVTVNSTNMLINPSFEQGFVPWFDWSNSSLVPNPNAPNGTNELRIGPGAGGSAQTVSAQANTTYLLSVWGRVTDGETGWIGIHYLDSTGNEIAPQSITEFSNTTYEQKQLSVQTSAETAQLRVWTWKNSGEGYFYVDNITLTKP